MGAPDCVVTPATEVLPENKDLRVSEAGPLRGVEVMEPPPAQAWVQLVVTETGVEGSLPGGGRGGRCG